MSYRHQEDSRAVSFVKFLCIVENEGIAPSFFLCALHEHLVIIKDNLVLFLEHRGTETQSLIIIIGM